MSGEMSIGREINKFITEAEANVGKEGIKKSNIGTEFKRVLFGDKMHEFVLVQCSVNSLKLLHL